MWVTGSDLSAAKPSGCEFVMMRPRGEILTLCCKMPLRSFPFFDVSLCKRRTGGTVG